jgi:hypothetical protein
MNLTQLTRFVVVAEELHFPRAADALGISVAALHSSIDKLEAEVGHPLFAADRSRTRLTQAGALLLADAKQEIAAAPPASKPTGPTGGKAKASKGKGRAPVVKGQPKPYKKRQGR